VFLGVLARPLSPQKAAAIGGLSVNVQLPVGIETLIGDEGS
jgi:hypothetical protein